MKSPLLEKLKKIAPAIVFEVAHTRDPDFRWDGDGPDPVDDGFDAYDVDFSAKTIQFGELIEGVASLGGVYERPGEIDPDVGGYLTQKLQEAAEDLLKRELNLEQRHQLIQATQFLEFELKRLYKEQQEAKACQPKK
jgi:hypothetical protein